MTAADWFWTGRNNAVDGQRCCIRKDVGLLKVAAYWIGVIFGCCISAFGVQRHN